MWKDLLERRMAVLRGQGPDKLKLRVFEVGSGIEASVLEQVVRAAGVSLSDDLLQLYREMNGVIANWSWYPKGKEIYGSIHIVSLQTALFGFNEMIERAEYEEAWKDSLWNTDSFAEDSIRELKEHRVFDLGRSGLHHVQAVAGRHEPPLCERGGHLGHSGPVHRCPSGGAQSDRQGGTPGERQDSRACARRACLLLT
jgi:hypothetical protein